MPRVPGPCRMPWPPPHGRQNLWVHRRRSGPPTPSPHAWHARPSVGCLARLAHGRLGTGSPRPPLDRNPSRTAELPPPSPGRRPITNQLHPGLENRHFRNPPRVSHISPARPTQRDIWQAGLGDRQLRHVSSRQLSRSGFPVPAFRSPPRCSSHSRHSKQRRATVSNCHPHRCNSNPQMYVALVIWPLFTTFPVRSTWILARGPCTSPTMAHPSPAPPNAP